MGPRPRGRGIFKAAFGWQALLALQWGHDRAVVELRRDSMKTTKTTQLQWGHDRAVVEFLTLRLVGRRCWRFNGATTARSWNWDSADRREADGHASMGPRPRGRGIQGKRVGPVSRHLLQWGHDRAVVELVAVLWAATTVSSFNGATTARSWNSG